MRKKPINIQWSPKFAYAVGLLATDGCLSSDERHIDFTSKDREQINNLKKCLGISNTVGRKVSGSGGHTSFRIQLGDVVFYKFLKSIGLSARKSKTIARLNIPDEFFFDFLRGHFDGDGTFYSYKDTRWKNSFMFYTELISASESHVNWLDSQISRLSGINGKVTKSKNNSAYRLKYAKTESLKLLRKLYYNASVVCLSRKRTKVKKALEFVRISL